MCAKIARSKYLSRLWSHTMRRRRRFGVTGCSTGSSADLRLFVLAMMKPNMWDDSVGLERTTKESNTRL